MTTKKKPLNLDKEETAQIFKQNEPLYSRLEEEAGFTLKEELKKTGIKVHSIPSRVKELEFFLNKVALYQFEKPFEEIKDIIGLRVICLFLADIEKIGNVIRDTFEVISEDNKIDNSKIASFGYLSVHFIVKLGKSFSGTRYNSLIELPFEIQVRTIAMDAWANISHYLDYKTDKDIPEELKKDFYALSGMFYVADKHFQLFFEQREEKTEEIAGVFESGTEDDINAQPINLDTLKAFLKEELPDLKQGTALSTDVQLFTQVGYKTIGEIKAALDRGREAAKHYLKKHEIIARSDTFLIVAIFLIHFDFYNLYMSKNRKDYKPISKNFWTDTFSMYKNDYS